MTRCLPAFLLFFLSSLSAIAQSDSEKAREQLQEMKDGVLLVRLFTNDAKIATLRHQGEEREAQRASNFQHQENKDIILSFSQVFQFCPVYFFYSEDSEAIRSRDFDGHIFDAALQPVDGQELHGKSIFTAEFSETENLGIEGLIIMDDQLFPLKSPFPFYQRKHTLLGLITLTKSKMVHRLNNKLRDTYSLWFPDTF